MRRRLLGRTGIEVGEISLGCEGFIGKTQAETDELFSAAFSHGVNCMDLYSPDPDMHLRIGRAIAARRDDFVIQGHLCSMWDNGQYRATRKLDEVKTAFEAMLANLGTDFVDIGMMHYVDSEKTLGEIVENGVLEYAKQLKAEGKIRAIGMSSHNPAVALAALPLGIEVLMFSVNPCYDLQPANEDLELLWADESYEKPLFNLDPQRAELYESCQRLGVGITVMKAFGGGDLLDEKLSPAGRAMSALQCLHYALTRPGVATVMAGAKTLPELLETLRYEDASDEEKDYAVVFSTFPKISWRGHCMYCGHCAPCPMGIDVAAVTKLLNLARAQGEVPETVREHYRSLLAKASDCVECASCEMRCPFEVPVIENMRAATQIFGE